MKYIYLTFFFLLIGNATAQTYVIEKPQSTKNTNDLFETSYSLLTGMIKDDTKYSFKKAVFSVENAYLEGKLDEESINNEIKILNSLSLSLIKDRFLYYPEKDKATVNKWASIFEVMCDTIPINVDDKEYRYIPFQL